MVKLIEALDTADWISLDPAGLVAQARPQTLQSLEPLRAIEAGKRPLRNVEVLWVHEEAWRVTAVSVIMGPKGTVQNPPRAEVILNPYFETAHAIFRREDLDAKEWRAGEDFLARIADGGADVGNAEAALAHADSDLCKNLDTRRFILSQQVPGNPRLQTGARAFSHVALLDFTVHVVAVRLVVGRARLFERNTGPGGHLLYGSNSRFANTMRHSRMTHV